jgi:hypothetical protein
MGRTIPGEEMGKGILHEALGATILVLTQDNSGLSGTVEMAGGRDWRIRVWDPHLSNLHYQQSTICSQGYL